MPDLKTLAVLLACSSVFGIQFRMGPSVRWTLWGSNSLSEVESVSYEYGETRVLFPETALLSFGLVIEGRIAGCIDANMGGYWNNYGPAYLSPPDSGSHSMNRNGTLLMIELGARHTFEDFFLGTGIEAHRYSETWADPFTGEEMSVDSICIGPKVEVGTMFEIPFGALTVSMAVVFPGFEHITRSVGASLLIP